MYSQVRHTIGLSMVLGKLVFCSVFLYLCLFNITWTFV